MESKFKLISSLEKVFFDYPEDSPEQTCGSMLKTKFIPFSWPAGRTTIETFVLSGN